MDWRTRAMGESMVTDAPVASTVNTLKSRTERAADTRRRLVKAATALFSERPYDDVNVADIAREAGAAHGLLFHHFGSKRGIYLAALELLAERHRASRDAYLAAAGAGDLRRLLEAHFGAVAAGPQPFLRLMNSGAGADPVVHEIFERDRWDSIETLCRHLELDSSTPAVRIALRGAVGGIDHAVLTWLNQSRPYPLEVLIDGLVAIIAGSVAVVIAMDDRVDTTAAAVALEAAQR